MKVAAGRHGELGQDWKDAVAINGGPTTFSGANTYSGGTTVNSVTLSDTVGSASFSPNSSITLTSGAQLDVNHNETINGLIGDSTTTVDLGSGASLVTAADPMVFQGDMTGAGSFDVGAGATEILTGTNNYTGGTTIAGTGHPPARERHGLRIDHGQRGR